MAGDILGIAVSGLLVAKRGLATTSHNISNVNTPGYSRQRAEFISRIPQQSGDGYIGTGVQVSSVRRLVDNFVTGQLRDASSALGSVRVFNDLATQVDNLLADPDAGLTPRLQAFFDSLNELADDPSSVPARQVVFSEAHSLAQRFHALDGRLAELRMGVNEQLATTVNNINSLASGVADLNRQIMLAQGQTQNQPANDLLDQREELVRQLSDLVNITVLEQGNGSINVSVGTGQVLIAGPTTAALSVVSNSTDPSRGEVGYTVNGSTVNISSLISGGELKGVLDFRTRILDGAQNVLGRVALGLSSAMNNQHRLGTDLNGVPGGDFFNDLGASATSVLADSGNTGAPPASINLQVKDAAAVTTSAYRLDRNAGAYTLTRLDDNTVTGLPGFPGVPVTVDGMQLTLTAGAIANGDFFLVEPVRNAARDIAVAVPNTAAIAASAPIIGQSSLANAGSGRIADGGVNSVNNNVEITFTGAASFDVVDRTTGAALASAVPYVPGNAIRFNGWTTSISGAPAAGDRFSVSNTVAAAASGNIGGGTIAATSVAVPDPNLSDAVTITFTGPNTFNVAGATTGSPTIGVAYVSGQPISFNGWTTTITGSPSVGDQFTISANSAGVGDNRNALLLADLQSVGTLDAGASTFIEAYGQGVTQVGTQTRQAEIGVGAQETLLAHVQQTRDSKSGVNLDEEAANLLRFQQLFQASARVVSAADEVFQTLLAAVGR